MPFSITEDNGPELLCAVCTWTRAHGRKEGLTPLCGSTQYQFAHRNINKDSLNWILIFIKNIEELAFSEVLNYDLSKKTKGLILMGPTVAFHAFAPFPLFCSKQIYSILWILPHCPNWKSSTSLLSSRSSQQKGASRNLSAFRLSPSPVCCPRQCPAQLLPGSALQKPTLTLVGLRTLGMLSWQVCPVAKTSISLRTYLERWLVPAFAPSSHLSFELNSL